MCNLLPESVAHVVVVVVVFVAINIDQTPQNFIVRRFTTLLNRIFMVRAIAFMLGAFNR